jgi:uncharacterized protein (DUF1778 family)
VYVRCIAITHRESTTVPKKTPISVRVDAGTKKAIDKAAKKGRRSTTSLVQIILDDWIQHHLTGKPMLYSSDAHFSAGGNLLDTPMPNGKRLGDCTGAELEEISEAMGEVAKMNPQAVLIEAMRKSTGARP